MNSGELPQPQPEHVAETVEHLLAQLAAIESRRLNVPESVDNSDRSPGTQQELMKEAYVSGARDMAAQILGMLFPEHTPEQS